MEKVSAAIRTAISAKQAGYEDLLAPLIARACVQIMPSNPRSFNVDNVRVAKLIGSGVHDSRVMKGMVVVRDAEGTERNDGVSFIYVCVCVDFCYCFECPFTYLR